MAEHSSDLNSAYLVSIYRDSATMINSTNFKSYRTLVFPEIKTRERERLEVLTSWDVQWSLDGT